MAANDVVFTVSAKDANFIKTFLAVKSEMDGVTKSFTGIDAKAKATGQTVGGMFRSAAGDAGKFALQMTGLGSVLAGVATVAGTIRAEYERFRETRLGAHEALLPIAQAREKAIQSMGGSITPAEDKRVNQIVQSAGMPAAAVWNAVENAFGAAGDLPNEQVIATLEAAAKATARTGDAGLLNSLTAAALDLMRGLPEGSRDPQKIVGALIASFGAHRGATPESLFQNVMPMVSQVMGMGGGRNPAQNYRDISGYIADMGLQAFDEQGRISSRGGLDLIVNLDEAIASTELKQFGFGEQAFRDKWSGMNGLERLEWVNSSEEGKWIRAWLLGELANDPEIREMASSLHVGGGRLHVDGRNRKTAIDYLSGPNNARLQAARKLGQQMPNLDSDEAQAAFDKFVRPKADAMSQYSAAQQKVAGLKERKKAENLPMAVQGSMLSMVEEMDKLEGRGAITSWINSLGASWTAATEADQMRMLWEFARQKEQRVVADHWGPIRGDAFRAWHKGQYGVDPGMNDRNWVYDMPGDNLAERGEELLRRKKQFLRTRPDYLDRRGRDDLDLWETFRDSVSPPASGTPGQRDQSSAATQDILRQMTMATEALNNAVAAMQVQGRQTVAVELSDPAGRALSERHARPLPAARFRDPRTLG